MVSRSELRLVDDEHALDAMLHALADAPRLALDTEFHAEHRYRPELMLIQIAAPDGRVWIVDAQKRLDLKALAPVLQRVPLVLHGGVQDIEILLRATGATPTRLLDTQRAAALIGLGYPTRLGAVARHALGVHMDKGASLTDWSLRPLVPRQLQYAAEDAAILLPLAEALERRLGELGRLGWAAEASQEVIAEAQQPSPEVESWMGWDIASQLDDEQRRAMRALFVWRDATGRGMDQPPRQILSDALALDIARRRPMTLGELIENRRIPQGLVKRHGAAIIGELRRAQELAAPAPRPPSQDELLRAQALELWAAAQERTSGLARALVLPRALALLVAARGLEALSGWRAEAVGDQVEAILGGRLAMKIARQGEISFIPC